MKIHRINIFNITMLFMLLVVSSCTKTEEQFSEPYPESSNGLGVRMDRVKPPQPAIGTPGTIVTVAATGLMPYKDELKFMFNGEVGEVLEVTQDYIKVKVPEFASTGVLSVAIKDVINFGPIFKVNGLINVDPTFRVPNGTNGIVRQILDLNDGKHLVVGGFTNYNNKGLIRPINSIASTFADFSYDPGLRSGTGANGPINNIAEYNGKFIIAGGFSGYNQRKENISNITMLNSNGTIDTMGVHTFRRPDQTDTIKYFPRFNAGTDRSISNISIQSDNKIIVSGGFEYFISRRYDQSDKKEEKDTVILDSIRMPQILRLNADGTLDKSYRFNVSENEGFRGANGPSSTIIHESVNHRGKILVYGRFTTFDGVKASNIIRLNADGTIDNTFKSGAGTDNSISSATYNSTLDRYVISGNFRSYDGKKSEYIALLKSDGTLDESFVPKSFNDAPYVYYAKQLNDGLIVVSGGFRTYDKVSRSGFMILNSHGGLAPGYNSTGNFNGMLTNVIETRSDDNKRALLLIGSFNRFNNEIVNNIMRIVLE